MSRENGWWTLEDEERWGGPARIERAWAAAMDEVRRMEARLNGLWEDYPDYRDAIGQHPVLRTNRTGPDPIFRFARRLRSYCVTLEGRLKRLRQNEETRSFLLAGFEVSGMEDVPAPEDGPSGSTETAEARHGRRLVGRLSAEVPAADRGVLEELAAGIVAEEHPERARTMLLELRLGIQRANDRVEEAKVEADRRLAEAVEDLRIKIRGFRGEDVERISAELDLVERRRAPLDGDLADRVDAVVKSAKERENQQYVARVMREELERLGYAVEEGFDSTFSDGGRTILKKIDEEELGVVVDVDGNAIGVEPVRVAGSGRQKAGKDTRWDSELESAWCGDFREVRRAMAGRGVRLQVGKRFPVGARRLKVHEGERGREEAAAAARAKRHRRRKPRVRQAAR